MERKLKRWDQNLEIVQEGWKFKWNGKYLDYLMPNLEKKRLKVSEIKEKTISLESGMQILFKSYLCKEQEFYFIVVGNYVPLTIRAGNWKMVFEEIQMPISLRYDVLPADEKELNQFIQEMTLHYEEHVKQQDEYAEFEKEMGYVIMPSEDEIIKQCMNQFHSKHIGVQAPNTCEADPAFILKKRSIDNQESESTVYLNPNMPEYGESLLKTTRKDNQNVVMTTRQEECIVIEIFEKDGIGIKKILEDTIFSEITKNMILKQGTKVMLIPRSDFLSFELCAKDSHYQNKKARTRAKITTAFLIIIIPEEASCPVTMMESQIPSQYLEESILHMLYELRTGDLIL